MLMLNTFYKSFTKDYFLNISIFWKAFSSFIFNFSKTKLLESGTEEFYSIYVTLAGDFLSAFFNKCKFIFYIINISSSIIRFQVAKELMIYKYSYLSTKLLEI